MKRVTMYVPVETAAQQKASNRITEGLLVAYGGYTVCASPENRGIWRAKGGVYVEKVATVTVLCDDPEPAITAIRAYGQEAREETIAYTVEEVEAHFESVEKAAV